MKLGVIGGSGIYDIAEIEGVKTKKVTTAFGNPSDEFIIGKLRGVEAVFLPRHDKNHGLLPGEINHKANIFAMKLLGVTHILSISAVGSFKEEMRPRDVVIADQYLDRTKRAADHTFFGSGLAAHIAFADPVCPSLAALAIKAADSAVRESADTSRKVHNRGTYVNMEGPAFSTRAESFVYKNMGMDIIGMTNLAEAKLAREAEICYCTVAMVTDYDCWHPDHDHVSVELIIGNLRANAELARQIIIKVAERAGELPGDCRCNHALSCAFITRSDAIPRQTLRKLEPIIGKYFPDKK